MLLQIDFFDMFAFHNFYTSSKCIRSKNLNLVTGISCLANMLYIVTCVLIGESEGIHIGRWLQTFKVNWETTINATLMKDTLTMLFSIYRT